jgi:hypothetical protein
MLELENIPSKQKLRMLQNTVGDVADLSNVKQLSDQFVARGGTHLGFDEYLKLLLSACYTYDKTHATPRSGQWNAYAATFTQDDDFYHARDGYTYGVDTDVTNILAHTTTMQFEVKPSGSRNDKWIFIPREEWLKLSPEKREEIIDTRHNERNAHLVGNQRLNSPVQGAKVRDTQEEVNVDDIIEYTEKAHLATATGGNGEESSYSPDA